MRAALPFTMVLCLLLACAPARARQQRWRQTPARTDAPAAEGSSVFHPPCPTITVECPDTSTSGMPITFTAKVSGAGPSPSLTYRWVVSAGTLTSDAEGSITTPSAERTAVVDTTGLPDQTAAVATFRVVGLDRSCVSYASCTAGVFSPLKPHPRDYYGNIRFEDEKARLDNFAIDLLNNPSMHGYIDCYGGRTGRRGEARARCERARRYVTRRRGVEPERVIIVDGGFREYLNVGLWVLPAGTEFWPSPTVDPRDVRFTDAPKRPRRRRPARRRG